MGGRHRTGPAPVMLVGNKSDKAGERIVTTQEGKALADSLGCEFLEASAKQRVNVEKAFYDVVRQLRRQRTANGRSEKRTNSSGAQASSAGKPKNQKEPRAGRDKDKRASSKCVIL